MLGEPRTVRCLALVALVGTLVLPLAAQNVTSGASAASDPDVVGAERLFSAWLEGQIAYRGLPGVAVGVVSDQELVWSKGFGFADIKARLPMTATTEFRIASNSKLFTAIAIMQLREEGKLGLDDPVVKYLPWFKEKPAGDDDGPITIEQLLSHSSGLQREAGDHWASNKFPTTDELERLYADRQAPFAPSVRWKYSNFAFALAGLVVEKVSGTRWADYVELNIFKPLGMDASSVDKNVAGLAVPYGRRMPDGSREVLPFVDARGMAAATGVTSNVEDLAKFVSAQFRRGPRGGRQIVSGPVVLANSDLIDKLGVVLFPSILLRAPIVRSLDLTFSLFSEPGGASARDPRPSPSTRRSATLRQATQTEPGGSVLVGLAERSLERLAVQRLYRQSLDRHRLAPARLSPVLGLEGATR
jgi:CubicO group peptidase (beta-lactamase class C family)